MKSNIEKIRETVINNITKSVPINNKEEWSYIAGVFASKLIDRMLITETSKSSARTYISKCKYTKILHDKVKSWALKDFAYIADNKDLSNLFACWVVFDELPKELTSEMRDTLVYGLVKQF